MIRNYEQLAKSKKRQDALEIVSAGISRVLPINVMRQAVKYSEGALIIHGERHEIKGRVFVVGAGKPSGLMAQELESILGADKITYGVVNCTSADYGTSVIKVNVASHPMPDKRGVDGVQEMLAIKEDYKLTSDDVVIALLGGGGSSLLPAPMEGISLEDMQRITRQLIMSGATINEMNAVRKHLSKVQGGKLGRHMQPAKVISLIISDVIGNELDVIASGPTVADTSTFFDSFHILEKHNILEKVPSSVRNAIENGMSGEIEETPKELSNCHNYIIGDNKLAVEAMRKEAEKLGYRPVIVTYELRGDPEAAANEMAKEIIRGDYKDFSCLIIGGETSPKVPEEHGSGGRNQHYALATMLAMRGYENEWVCVSAGTDGSDFLTDYAGAIVDNSIPLEGAEEHLKRFDSFNFLQKYYSHIITGITGTNVCDVIVYLL